MTPETLTENIRNRSSFLCVGLDTDPSKLPGSLRSHPDGIFEFNKAIIDSTKDLCVAYKINTAFYEVLGAKGWEIMERTLAQIPPGHFTIADAKRGDIGNTSAQYAKTFFETYSFDAVTVAPYMGEDSIRPFLEYDNKFAIVLGLTSNKGADDFEWSMTDGKPLYQKVLSRVASWSTPGRLMFVAGATRAAELEKIREIVPEHFLLVPGVGAQGGSLQEVAKHGMNKNIGLLVNVSRDILYAGSGDEFASKARESAQRYQAQMAAQVAAFDTQAQTIK